MQQGSWLTSKTQEKSINQAGWDRLGESMQERPENGTMRLDAFREQALRLC